MTTRKNLNATKKLQKPNTHGVEANESIENDDILLEDDGDDFDFTDFDIEDDELDFGEDESDDDDLDFTEDESDDDDLDFTEDESEDDDLDFTEDESEDDDLDLTEDESEDDDLDLTEDESEDDDLDFTEDESEDDDLFSDTAELDNDPFAFVVSLRKPALPVVKKMLMTATEVDYKNISAAESKYGNAYQTFSITCDVKHPTTKEVVTIKEFGTNTNARFIKLVTALNNGTTPKSLSKIIGKKAIVTIKHKTDELGNVWDNIDTVEPYNPSSKKK